MSRLCGLVVAALFLAPVMVPASPGPGSVPRLFGTFRPVPGVWAEYRVVDKVTGREIRMRMSIVGKEGDGVWYEVLQDDGGSRNIVKMLVRGDPDDPDNIERLILKSGDAPAVEMPRDFVAMGRRMAVHMFERRSGVPVEGTEGLRVVDEGRRTVTVPAGTFRATLRKIVDPQGKVLATYAFDPDVPPFGVITSDTGRTTMELVAYGRDATSAITETPAPMAFPPGMPKGLPRGMPPGMPGARD